jgi:hypothetical protein
MVLPDSIQKQLDEAEALEALMAPDTDTPDTQEPEEPEEPEAQVVEVAPEPPAPPAVDWEHKYKSLEGKFNSQASKFQQEASNTQAQIQALTDELAKLKQKPAEQTKSREVEEDEELVGSDIVKAAERAAARAIATVQAKLDVLEDENAKLKQALGQVSENQSSLSADTFYEKLTAEVSDWRTLETTEKGQSFLHSRIPGTGKTWNDALLTAAHSFDVAETAEIYNELVRRHPELRETKPQPTREALEKQVTPSKKKSAAVPDTKKVWTLKEYTDSWDSINKRAVKGEEARKLHDELEAAMAEGRVR